MRGIINIFIPWGLIMCLIGVATLFFGADTPLSQYVFSGLILTLSAIIVAWRRHAVPYWVGLAGALIGLFVLKEMAARQLILSGAEYACLVAGLAVVLIGRESMMLSTRITPMWQLSGLIFLVISCWAFVDFITAPETLFGQARPYHEDRLSAAFLSANVAATFFGVIILSSLALLVQAFAKTPSLTLLGVAEGLFRHGALAIVTLLVAMSCLLLTGSRAGIGLTFIAAVILIVWEVWATRNLRQDRGAGAKTPLILPVVLAVLAISSVAALAMLTSGDVVGERATSLEQSANSRGMMFAAYWQGHLEAPFFGQGLGAFGVVNQAQMTAENAHVLTQQGAAHNVVLQWLIQTGWVGFLLAAAMIGFIHWRIILGLKRRRRYRPFLRAVLCISFFVFAHNMVDFSLEVPGLMWWWALLLGFGWGIADGRSADRRAASRPRPRSG